MQVKEIDGFSARCEAKGIERVVSLFMMQHENIAVGDYIMISMGQAIQKMTDQEAAEAWDLYDEMFQRIDESQ